MQILSHIFNQSTDKDMNKTIVITVWSVSVLVLNSIFSSGVLHSIVNREQTKINTIEDMITATNMSVAIRHNSWIWWQFEAKKRWNVSLDNNMKAIKHKVMVFDDTQIKDKVLLTSVMDKLKKDRLRAKHITRVTGCP